MIEITESKMVFGPYDEVDVYEIEKSGLNQKAGDNISTVEFMLVRDLTKVLFIEAKSSTPNFAKNRQRFEEFINEIVDKFIHSFELYQALRFRRYESDIAVGSNLWSMDWKDSSIKFVFVIQGHQKEWLPPIREALLKEMTAFCKIWKSDVIVLNDEMAKRRSLISAVC